MAQLPYSPFPENEGVEGSLPDQSINVIPAAFGSGIAQSAGKMGQTLERVGQQQFSTAMKLQEMQNETEVNNKLQNASDFTIAQEGAFRQLQGQNAVDAFPQFQKALQDHREQLAASINSPAARVAFQREAQPFYQRSLYSAVLHTGDQARIANDQSWQGTIESDIAQGALHADDPDSFNEFLGKTTEDSMRFAHVKGQDQAGSVFTQQKAVGELVKRSVDTFLSKNDIEGAQNLFQHMQEARLPDSGKPAMDAASADAIAKGLRTAGKTIYDQQDKAATAAINARVGLAIKTGDLPIADGVNELTDSVNAFSDKLNITDPNQRAERISDAATGLGISVIEGIGADIRGTSPEDDRRRLTAQQDAYEKLLNMKLPGFPDQPLLNSRGQDSIVQRLQMEANRVENREEVEQNKQAAILRVPLLKSFENGTAMVDNGVPATDLPSDSDWRAAFPRNPEEAQARIDATHELQRVSGFLTNLPNMNIDQMERLREQVAPSASRPNTFAQDARLSRALDTAIGRTEKQIKDDSAGYFVTRYGLQDSLHTALEHPVMAATYVDKITTLQTQMGVPAQLQHVLPAGTAQGIANALAADPASAGQKIAALQQHWDGNWGKVWHDISTIGKLPADYQLVGSFSDKTGLNNEKDAELLSRALLDGKAGKDLPKLIGEKQAQTFKTTVENDPSVLNYMRSLSASGASAEQMEGIKDAITKLAYAKGFYNRDPTAAASAIHDVIGKYEFMGDARIPTANSGTVKPAIRRVLGSMDETNIQVPAQAGQPGMPSAREYVESIKAAPHWITSPDGKGLMLQDNYQRFVRDKSGRPVSIPFDGPTVPLSRNAPPQAAPAAPPVAKQRRSLEDIFGGR